MCVSYSDVTVRVYRNENDTLVDGRGVFPTVGGEVTDTRGRRAEYPRGDGFQVETSS